MPQEVSLPPDGSDLSTLFAQGFSDILQRAPTAEEITKFKRYLDLLLRWNRVYHLTAYRRPEEIAHKLLFDSLLFLKVLPPMALKLLDFGSGAGIPGIPLKIASSPIALTLVETRRNRNSFLAMVVRELGLREVTLLRGRAERVLLGTPELQGAFDAVLVRAVGPLLSVIPVALRFLRSGGVFIASGPPIQSQTPPLPRGIPALWKLVPSPLDSHPRRFLVVQKAD